MQNFKVLVLTLCTLILACAVSPILAQTCPSSPGSGSPYVLIDSVYQVGTVASGKTNVGICYVNPTQTKITGLQFRLWYDTTAFDGATPIVSSVNSAWSQSLQYVVNETEGNITITLVYTGSSSVFSIPDGRQFNIEFTHSPNFQNYTNISNIKVTGMTAFSARSSNINGLDDTLTLYSYGGEMRNVKLKFHGQFTNVTGSGAKNLTLALEKKPKSGSSWTQVSSYKTGVNGEFSLVEDVDTTYYDARLFVNGDTLGVGNIVSTADAQKINDWVLGTATPSGFDYYTGDVNGSNGITVSDVYGLFGRIAGRFTAWPNAVKDILFFSESEYSQIAGSNVNLRPTIPGVTNLYHTISGISVDSVRFYVASPGDANGTGYNMARLTPIRIINPANASKHVIDEAVEYDTDGLSKIEINMPTLSVGEGNLVNIPVTVKTRGSQVGALQLALNYDSTLLEFKALNGTEKTQKWMTFINPNGGTVEWGGFDPSAKLNLVNNAENVVTLQFVALKPQDEWGKSPLYTSRKFAGDDMARDVNITPTNGVIEIRSASFRSTTDGLSVFPNPTAGEIHVSFKITKDANVLLAVYNLNGQVVLEVVNEKMPKGQYQYVADLGKLTQGIYTAVLHEQDAKLLSKKILKTN
jgi:hypothetical protein